MDFTEPGGNYDYVLFGEAPDATDGIDIFYDAVNLPGGVSPFLDAYFTTDFSWPHDTLLQEIKAYPDTYKMWNFTVLWTGTDTMVTITWNTTDINESEYDTIILYDNVGTYLVDMLTTNNYVFFCPSSGPISFKIIATVSRPPTQSNPYPEKESTGVEQNDRHMN